MFVCKLSYKKERLTISNGYETDVAKETTKEVGKRERKLKEEVQTEAPFPQGISLTSVSGIDIPTEEAGNVCQFLEFCLAFGKVWSLLSIMNL